MTILILSLYNSISLYYSSHENKIYKGLHLLCCYINISLVCVLMFTYIGYGFMVYNMKNQNLDKPLLNITGSQNLLNTIVTFISYGLDNLSQESGIKLIKAKTSKFINIHELIFSLVSKIFLSTYIALVLTFLGNTLFKNSDNKE